MSPWINNVMRISIFALLGGSGISSLVFANDGRNVNIALNAPVTVSKPSTESYTKDKNPAQLTDGEFAGSVFDSENDTSSMWVQKGALTWRVQTEPIVVTIDLGAVRPIAGVSYSTSGGRAGVQFPSSIALAVSEDNQNWFYQGDLTSMSRKNGTPPLEGYSTFHYKTSDLKTKGRYVALSIIQTPYTVVDEIEVYAGQSEWLNQPIGGEKLTTLKDIERLAKTNTIERFVQRRISEDVKSIKAALNESALATPRKNAFIARLDKALEANDRLRLPDENIRTILPINDTHREVMAVYGEFLATQNFEPLTIWNQHRYGWLSHLDKPQKQQNMALEFSMLKNQFRSDAFLITNASPQEKEVSIELQNPPAGAGADWLQLHSVAWTDTYQGIPVADAFLPAERNGNNYWLKIPAGFTRKVWLIVDSSKVMPGSYKSTLRVNQQRTIPLNLFVATTTMQRPRMSLTVWDYSDNKSLGTPVSRAVNAKNQADVLALMKSHYVDSPEASRPILPWPKAEDYHENHQLKNPLSFTAFDNWVADWPEARRFFVFVSVKQSEQFAGAEPGTKAFNERLANWALAVSRHMKTLNLRPAQLTLSLFDEPGLRGEKTNDEWENKLIADWAQPLKASGAGIDLIANPVWKRPDLQKVQSAFTSMDILMPLPEHYYKNVPQVRDYYQAQRFSGIDLWLYSCSGPVRLFSPQQYYRGQAWRVFALGGKGMGFWSFGDAGPKYSSWRDYDIASSYSPAFIDENSVSNSVHWESVREGVQDFEELSMLQAAIDRTRNPALKQQAKKVLADALKVINSSWATVSELYWYREENPEIYDQQLQKVRKMIEALNA